MRTSINLLPPALRRQQMAHRRVVQWSVVVCIVLTTIWGAGWISIGEYPMLSQKLEVLSANIVPITPCSKNSRPCAILCPDSNNRRLLPASWDSAGIS